MSTPCSPSPTSLPPFLHSHVMLAIALPPLLLLQIVLLVAPLSTEATRINLNHRRTTSELAPFDAFELALASIRNKYAGVLPQIAPGRRAAGDVELTNLYADACVASFCHLRGFWLTFRVLLVYAHAARTALIRPTLWLARQGPSAIYCPSALRIYFTDFLSRAVLDLPDSGRRFRSSSTQVRAPPVRWLRSTLAADARVSFAFTGRLQKGSSDLWISSSACTTCTGADDLFADAKSTTLVSSSSSFAICASSPPFCGAVRFRRRAQSVSCPPPSFRGCCLVYGRSNTLSATRQLTLSPAVAPTLP